jgi:hypothetical protein
MKTSLEDQKRFLDAVRGAPGGPGFIMFLNERQKGCPLLHARELSNSRRTFKRPSAMSQAFQYQSSRKIK